MQDESIRPLPIASSHRPFTCGVTGATYTHHEFFDRCERLARTLASDHGWPQDAQTPWDKVACIFSLNTVSCIAAFLPGFLAPGGCLLGSADRLYDGGVCCPPPLRHRHACQRCVHLCRAGPPAQVVWLKGSVHMPFPRQHRCRGRRDSRASATAYLPAASRRRSGPTGQRPVHAGRHDQQRFITDAATATCLQQRSRRRTNGLSLLFKRHVWKSREHVLLLHAPQNRAH